LKVFSAKVSTLDLTSFIIVDFVANVEIFRAYVLRIRRASA